MPLKTLILALAACWPGAQAAAAGPTAEEIVRAIDKNRVFKSQYFEARMVITKGKRKLTKAFQGWGESAGSKSFMSFTNREDKGVKYLKLKDELWIYLPDADSELKISGHMLRQGMMGSDLSYEDMLEKDSWEESYRVKRLEDKEAAGSPCWVVDMEAMKRDLAYARQTLYVDQKTYVPLVIEMYAAGGRMLKSMTQSDLVNAGGRWVARKISIQDKRKKDSVTELEMLKLEYDLAVPAGTFSKSSLRK